MLLPALMALGACAPVLDSHAWYFSQYKNEYPSLFQPDYVARQPDPVPDVRAVIGSDLARVFGHTQVKNVAVGPPRPNGYGWAACIRAEVFGITGADLGTQTFFVEIDRGAIGLRRPAESADHCEAVRYETI